MSLVTYAQPYQVSGKVTDEKYSPLPSVEVDVLQNDTLKHKVTVKKDGTFIVSSIALGAYVVRVRCQNYAVHTQNIRIADGSVHLPPIALQPLTIVLDEVSVVQQALAVVQKDDTVEYNSGAYKLNPDADASDLVRKMPSIVMNGQTVTSQGTNVVKVLVDGKPFFGNDPYGTLKSLPAYVVKKVQVYNEKSEQEQLSGFSEGPINKTINIITHENMRRGVFGNASAGAGADNSGQTVYNTGLTANRFDGDRRISFVSQVNNVNVQNFTEQNSTGSNGITNVKMGSVNYSDKWGKKTDITASYRYNTTHNSLERQIQRQYILPSGQGQNYVEQSPSDAQNRVHQVNVRIATVIDSMNSFSFQPTLSFAQDQRKNRMQGATYANNELLNNISNTQSSSRHITTAAAYMVYMRKFRQKGRTLSALGNVNYNANAGGTNQYANRNFYTGPIPGDTLDQQISDSTRSFSITGNTAYTTPAGKNGIIKLQCDMSYQPSGVDRSVYNGEMGIYTVPDSALSGSSESAYTSFKPGASYMYRKEKFEMSVGADYQAATLFYRAETPTYTTLRQAFGNLLPIASFKYKISRTQNMQCNYSTSTSVPAVTQLQPVVNNTDPLHLYTGNPSLRQPYSHNMSLVYSSSALTTGRLLSVMLTGSVVQSFIATSSVTAYSDTAVGNLLLPAGTQLSMPVNINGNRSLMANTTYSRRINPIKCMLNINASGRIFRMPSIINNVMNYQQNNNADLNVSLTTTISETIDCTLGGHTSFINSSSTANPLLQYSYLNQTCRATVNIIALKSWVINSTATFQLNSGAAPGFNDNFLLWNMAIGRKLFKKKQGDIHLLVFDVLNDNKNISRTVRENYIQDTRANMLQRYAMLSFTYKMSAFRKGKM